MENPGDSCGVISKNQLDELVRLFDGFEYAPDPNTRAAKEAESDFNAVLDRLYEQLPRAGISLTPAQFKLLVRKRCQEIVVSETKRKHTSLPPSA